ncbi:MAG: hypothetical protein DMD84_21665 [Candidatus Rokuibacteriota bacterium]|nr:MAG: hypothetical protein DMD84_21665 [Candidatus Rokubacteria bacterium]
MVRRRVGVRLRDDGSAGGPGSSGPRRLRGRARNTGGRPRPGSHGALPAAARAGHASRSVHPRARRAHAPLWAPRARRAEARRVALPDGVAARPGLSAADRGDRGLPQSDRRRYHRGALPWLEKALEVGPRDLKALYNYAVTLEWLDRREEAIAAYQKVLAVEPANAKVHASLGMAFDRLGRHDQARRQMELALQLDPGQREARDYFNHQFGRDARGGPTAFTAR